MDIMDSRNIQCQFSAIRTAEKFRSRQTFHVGKSTKRKHTFDLRESVTGSYVALVKVVSSPASLI